jgi:hypothetical protein
MIGYVKVYFHQPYRQTEGIVKGHAKNKIPSISDFSTINRRINRLDVNIKKDGGENANPSEEENGYILIAIDSSDIKKTNRGQWMNKKWNMQNRNGYLNIHVAVNIKTKEILSMREVTADEHVRDNRMLPKLVNSISNDEFVSDIVLADVAYDSNGTFRFLSENGIIPCIKVRKNSRVRKTAHLFFMNLSVIAQRIDFEQWKDGVSYGQRWMVG